MGGRGRVGAGATVRGNRDCPRSASPGPRPNYVSRAMDPASDVMVGPGAVRAGLGQSGAGRPAGRGGREGAGAGLRCAASGRGRARDLGRFRGGQPPAVPRSVVPRGAAACALTRDSRPVPIQTDPPGPALRGRLPIAQTSRHCNSQALPRTPTTSQRLDSTPPPAVRRESEPLKLGSVNPVRSHPLAPFHDVPEVGGGLPTVFRG